MHPLRLSRWLFAVAAAPLVVGCGSSDNSGTTSTAPNQVAALASLAFSPASISIRTGDSVTWVFQSVGHNVTFDAASGVPADIGGTNANITMARTFSTPGTFTYHCTIHPSMTGTVNVGSTVVDPPPAPPPPPPAGYIRHG